MKRNGWPLSPATWARIVNAGVDGSVAEPPLAALFMACAINGLQLEETAALTQAMIDSGERIAFDGVVVDKHSSGGVGDVVSLVIVPLVAACGVRVAKLSGRALGHTGGTLNKLEAIPGVRTDLAPDAFVAQVNRLGCAIAAQSERIVPADKRFYDLRDRTGTVESVGLIAASIVSKKIAGGASAIVYDVKAGGAAFMHDLEAAKKLAWELVALTRAFSRRASAIVTDMDQPLAPTIGPLLEAIEARDFLRGSARDARFADVVMVAASEMLRVGEVADDEILARLGHALASGEAYETFVALVEAQGGTRAGLEGLEIPAIDGVVRAERTGVVARVDARALGIAARDLGDQYGPAAGFRVRARVGDAVRTGDILLDIHGASSVPQLDGVFTVGDEPVEAGPLVLYTTHNAPDAPSSNAPSA